MNKTNLIEILSTSGFRQHEDNQLWYPAEHNEFGYSDGDDAENYIADAIASVSDLSINSEELEAKMVDWPSIYHLSSSRSNLLKPFSAWFKNKRVLEIGCGCGAITRFLGECGAQVVSVEGSLRRASIARSRSRDLPNVTVICAPADTLPDLGEFDAVLLIGVLEYARVFVAENGEYALLEDCRKRLNSDGKLFVAIENKLGIKYFSGACEDHVNLPMFGINNSYNEKGVVTFGRQELIRLLGDCGFSHQEEYIPLPDYKLPCTVVTPLGWKKYSRELSQLALESAHKDKQAVPEHLFSLEQGIKNIWDNGLAADMSSSFLMIASVQIQPELNQGVAAFHYSDSRQVALRKTIAFVSNDNELTTSIIQDSGHLTTDVVPVKYSEAFIKGQSLWVDFVHIINRPHWRIEEVADWARGWINQVLLRTGKSLELDAATSLPVEYLDALPFNVILDSSGNYVFFDQEWEAADKVTLGYLAFRGVFHSFLRITSVGNSRYCLTNNISELCLAVLKAVGFQVDGEDLRNYLKEEASFLSQVQHKDEQEIYTTLKTLNLTVRAEYWINAEDFSSLQGQAETTHNNDSAQIDELKASLNREEAISAELRQQLQAMQAAHQHDVNLLAQYKHDMDSLLTSASWKISAPFRVLGRRVPFAVRGPVKRIFFRCFYLGQRIKVKAGQVLRRVLQHSAVAELKRNLRSSARSLYYRLPERYKAKALTLAMKIRPSWFAHHPSFMQAAYDQQLQNPIDASRPPVFISHHNDGTYHFAERPDEYVYIPARKPHHYEDLISELEIKPTFSIIVPIYNTPLDLLELMVNSVKNQWYENWELVLANDCSPMPEIAPALDAFNDPRIKVIHMPENQGIAGATNVAIEAATGDYIVFLDHDDELTDDCLYEFVQCINEEDPDFIYSDEDKFTPEGDFSQPHFKPDWSPDTMMGTMYTCHAACVRRSKALELGGLRSEYNGCQDWDFILRLSEITDKISHIPKILYHWRIIPASVASDITAKPYVLAASKAVREAALERRGVKGEVEELNGYLGYFRVNYHIKDNTLVSIIIPSRDNHEVLARCIDSIFEKTRWHNFEIVVVDNGSQQPAALDYLATLNKREGVKVIRHDVPFNFSELNNIGVANSSGELLLFLNDDTEVMQADWLERLGGYAQQKHIGAVGAKLLYADGHSMQHAGIINLHSGPMHAYLRQHKDHPGYFLRNQIEYNWLAVTGACLMVERAKYEKIGGFDETFPVAYNDVDLCMLLVEEGYYNVMCQAVTLIHHESLSRGLDHMNAEKYNRLMNELSRLNNKHPQYYQYDPFFNINFSSNGYNFEIMK
ncbi:MAG: glycosyltransferase [Pantoea sp.]|uniref:glycosyltransferase n=1 Tax=Pantoea sp. TaxID=69393 RepID=UPI0023A666BC|nr:glycosyltransferase [Pantoea sp.]MDE1185045.1 glycosyltransferase [Pantoea sp.]